MSYTSVYALYETKVNCVAELHNGHGSGPAVWDYVSNKLYNKNFNSCDDKNFWPSWKDSRLDDGEKAALLSTYDRAFVEIDHLMVFAEACRAVHALIINTSDWSHFEQIGNAAETLHNDHDHRCRGLAIGCTSVCDEWEGGNIADIDTWGVYKEIADLNAEAA